MSNLVKHAEREMRAARLYDKDADYGGMIPDAVMALVKVHSEQGHSGMSHALTLKIFNRVIEYKTLTPITNDPAEWMQIQDEVLAPDQRKDGLWQNRRQVSCFSSDGGKTYYDIDDKKREVKPTVNHTEAG